MEQPASEIDALNAESFIVQPQEIDVLCGRGGDILRHPGNVNYRDLIRKNKTCYSTCEKNEKIKISKSIVAAVRVIGGRFLDRDVKNKTRGWFDIGDKKAVEKTSQALREGQPKLRLKLINEGALDEPYIPPTPLESPPNPPSAKKQPPKSTLGRQAEMAPVRPPRPPASTLSAPHDMFRRMSLENSKASSASNVSGIPAKAPIAHRAFTVDMGVPLSPLSQMSDFSAMMGSIDSRIGSVAYPSGKRRPSDTSTIPSRRPSDAYSIASRRFSDMSHSKAGVLMNGMSMMSLTTIDSDDFPAVHSVASNSKYSNISMIDSSDFLGFHPVGSNSACSNISSISGLASESKRSTASPRHSILSDMPRAGGGGNPTEFKLNFGSAPRSPKKIEEDENL